MSGKRMLQIGGVVSGGVLVAFGIVVIVLSFNGRSTVNSSLKDEQITGSPDMSPSTIAGEVSAAKEAQSKLVSQLQSAGVQITPSPIETPSCSVAGEQVTDGSKARCFAKYMRIHTFQATSGLTYSQMGRYTAKPGTPVKNTDGLGGTNDAAHAVTDPKTQQPVNNGRRDIWVTYTALTTALNSSYLASQFALFGVVVGIALLLAGVGFIILALAALRETPAGTREPAAASSPA